MAEAAVVVAGEAGKAGAAVNPILGDNALGSMKPFGACAPPVSKLLEV
jgi:hypothetical protein